MRILVDLPGGVNLVIITIEASGPPMFYYSVVFDDLWIMPCDRLSKLRTTFIKLFKFVSEIKYIPVILTIA